MSIKFVPRSKHFVSVVKTNLLILCREISLFSEVHTKHINTPYGKNLFCPNVKPSGIIKYHLDLKGYRDCRLISFKTGSFVSYTFVTKFLRILEAQREFISWNC